MRLISTLNVHLLVDKYSTTSYRLAPSPGEHPSSTSRSLVHWQNISGQGIRKIMQHCDARVISKSSYISKLTIGNGCCACPSSSSAFPMADKQEYVTPVNDRP